MTSFLYSNDNKRYHTFSYATKKRYGHKVFKVGLNAGLSCPNRDGSKGLGGCDFCNAIGSGDFQGNTQAHLLDQYQKGLEIQRNKWPRGLGIAYFQAFTNTYAPLEKLKELYEPFFRDDSVIALSIATRMDCLDESILNYLESMCAIKDVYVELGLQTIHTQSLENMNRQEDFASFKKGYQRLLHSPLKVIIHLLNGYPGETTDMMIQSAQAVGQLHPWGIKLHMLNVLKDARLGLRYLAHPFPLLSQDSYVELVVEQLRVLPPEVVILRLTGDGDEEELIEPQWIKNKIQVLNDIDKRMAKLDVTQGDTHRDETCE